MNVRRFFRRSHEDLELAQELDAHLEHEIDDNLASGMKPEEARRQAHLKLGNPLVIRDRVWETNRISWLEDLWRDLRYAARILAKSPCFTLVALLVMALGIGANTAIYSFLDSLLLRALPVADPQSLVVSNWHAKPWPRSDDRNFVMQSMSGWTDEDSKLGVISGIFPYAAFEQLQRDDGVFSDLFGYCQSREVRTLNVLIKGQADVAGGELVTGNYFRALGVVSAAGRLIVPQDDRAGAPPVAVVSYAFSEKHFGGPEQAAGQSVQINNLPFTIVGVAPPEFFGVDPSHSRRVSSAAHQPLIGSSDSIWVRPLGLSGCELLLVRDDGALASRCDTAASAG
jgi:hypothetical protein